MSAQPFVNVLHQRERQLHHGNAVENQYQRALGWHGQVRRSLRLTRWWLLEANLSVMIRKVSSLLQPQSRGGATNTDRFREDWPLSGAGKEPVRATH